MILYKNSRSASLKIYCIQSGFYTRNFKYISISIMLAAISCIITPETKAENLSFNEHKNVVVLDPGHGGHDKGIEGPAGLLEKKVTLILCRIIANELADRYRTAFTRSDDYWVDIPDRAATANHLKADIFISIHTGGSFLHKAKGMTIFYFKEISKPKMLTETLPAKISNTGISETAWENLNKKHTDESMLLAGLIRDHLLRHLKNIEININGAPLLVLSGADTPAVLVEVGYLTNPVEEKALKNMEVLAKISKGISQGADDFLKKYR